MAGWQLSWRVTLTWQSARYSPTGEAVQMVDVPMPARLRELVLAARANPLILNYSYRRHRFWDGSDAPRTCRRGHELLPGRGGGRDCLCATGHFASTCWCGDEQQVPPLGPGCGPVPVDPEADRHHW